MTAFKKGTTSKDIGAKVGDKFRVVDISDIYDLTIGEIVTFHEDDGSELPYFICHDGSDVASIRWSRLEPIARTIRDMQVGDIIVDWLGNKTKVLAVLGDVFLKSTWGEYTETGSWYTFDEAEQNGWKLEGQEETSTTELTLKQIADKFGISVDKLRIKDE